MLGYSSGTDTLVKNTVWGCNRSESEVKPVFLLAQLLVEPVFLLAQFITVTQLQPPAQA